MSRAPLKAIAESAMPMPWEPHPPLGCLTDFRAAITPELFLEMLAKLEAWQAVCDRITDQYGGVLAGVNFGALGRANQDLITKVTT